MEEPPAQRRIGSAEAELSEQGPQSLVGLARAVSGSRVARRPRLVPTQFGTHLLTGPTGLILSGPRRPACTTTLGKSGR